MFGSSLVAMCEDPHPGHDIVFLGGPDDGDEIHLKSGPLPPVLVRGLNTVSPAAYSRTTDISRGRIVYMHLPAEEARLWFYH